MLVLIIIAIIIVLILIFIIMKNVKNSNTINSAMTEGGNTSKKYVICGDIHGNKEQFNEMMKYVNQGYTAIFLGDLTQEHNEHKHNMTDFSKQIYELIKDKKLIWVCGNHDLLQYYANKCFMNKVSIHPDYPQMYQKPIEWAKNFKEEQKWFMKCFDEHLVKFKLLMDNKGNILPEDTPLTDINCFSHWVINKDTPIKTTKDLYDLLKITDNEHFEEWFKIYNQTWTREDDLTKRIYKNHYVGHSALFVLLGRSSICDRVSEETKIKIEMLTYLMFKAFWSTEIDKFCSSCGKTAKFFEQELKKYSIKKILDDVTNAGFYGIENIHLCDVHPDSYEMSLLVKDFPESSPKVFLLEF